MPRYCFALLALLLASSLHAADVPAPPATRTDDVQTGYFDQTVADPYRWLEKSDSPEVMEWFRAQNAYARAVLDRIPGRAALRARLSQLSAASEKLNTLQTADHRLFYLKRGTGDNQYKLFVRAGAAAEERVLLDPARYDAGSQRASITYYHASPNGRYLAYGVAVGGSEKSTLHVMEVDSGRETGDPIERADFDDNGDYAGFAWQMDSRSFFYNQLQEPGPGAPPTAKYQNSEARLRVLPANGASAADQTVVSRAVQPAFNLTEDDVPMVHVSPVSPYAIVVVKHGDQNQLTLYAALLTELKGADTTWKLVADVAQNVTEFDLRGDYIYMLSNEDAPRGKLVRLSLSQALQAAGQGTSAWDQAETVIPAGARVLTGLAVAKDALYVSALDDGYGKLMRLQFNIRIVKEVKGKKGKKATRVTKSSAPKHAGVASRNDVGLPFAGSVGELVTDPLQPGAWIKLESWNEPPRIYFADGKTGRLEATALLQPPQLDLLPVTVTRVKVKSHDGVSVPLSIVHRKGLKLDGARPTLLTGYGAYGLRLDPRFNATWTAWLEQGGVMAVAHVRGGGEYGEEWHLAGRKATKPNTWKDFIACAEWLARNGYTDRAHLAGSGGSAGGITIGRAITERPELFSAAVSMVGAHDSLRAELTANGPPNIPEFGSTKTPEGFRALFEMSAYHHVRDATAYPAVLLTTGINDPRVDSWEPGKMAARLQAATASGKPVLLSVDFAGGHGLGSTRDQANDELADRYAFLLWQMGAPGFQPQ